MGWEEDDDEDIDWDAVERSALEQARSATEQSRRAVQSTAALQQVVSPVNLLAEGSSRCQAGHLRGNPGRAAAAELRHKIHEFKSIANTLPPTLPKSSVCPGVYGRGCGGQLQWVCYGDRTWAHWGCSNQCAYREYPAPRKATPELSIQIDTAETVKVTALPGAEEAVLHCGGVEAVLRAAGVNLQLAIPEPPAVQPDCHPAAEPVCQKDCQPPSAGHGTLALADAFSKAVLAMRSLPLSPPRHQQSSGGAMPLRMTPSVPASPAGLLHQLGAGVDGALRIAQSLPTTPISQNEGASQPERGPPGSLAGTLQTKQVQHSHQQEPDTVEGGTVQLQGHQQAAGSASALPPVQDGMWQEPPHAGHMRFQLADYEVVRDALGAFKQQTGVMLLSTAGSIPKGALMAYRGQLYSRPPLFEAEQRYGSMPSFLEAALMPFQREGVLFGLRCGGKVILADEMGVGKTVQAIALASCYQEEWPLLIIVPASLRLVWAEELEKWLPQLRPSCIHVIEGKEGRVAPPNLPRITITSFEMMQRLTCEACKQRGQAKAGLSTHTGNRCAGSQLCMAAMGWRVIIVDESHQLRTGNRPPDAQHTEAVVSAVRLSRRAVFLTGTPSLSRPYDLFRQVDALKPGLLGRERYEFAAVYCNRRAVPVPGGEGRLRYDNNGLSRAAELHALLRREVMLRRLKRDVLSQLPPKRRQVIRLPKPKPEQWPKQAVGGKQKECSDSEHSEGAAWVGEGTNVEPVKQAGAHMSDSHRTALAKLPSVIEWVMHALGARRSTPAARGSQHRAEAGMDEEESMDGLTPDSSPKFLLFAHHRDVMDGLAAALDGASGFSAVPFVRIDGATDGEGRRVAAARFRADPNVRVALLSVTAAGVGLDFSCGSVVVFAELPEDPSWVRQAEDRAHRKGQRLPVNVYFMCAKGTIDDRRWQFLSRSLAKVSAVMDGGPALGAHHATGASGAGGCAAAAAQGGLVVDGISDADTAGIMQAVPTQLRPHGPALRNTSNLRLGQGIRDVGQALQHLLHAEQPPLAAAAALLVPPQPAPAAAARLGHPAPQRPLPAPAASAAVGECGTRVPSALQPASAEAAGVEEQSKPDNTVQVWFEVSSNTNRVHFHTAPDGTRPLRLSLPIEALTGPPDSPLVEELLQAVGSATTAAAAAACPSPAHTAAGAVEQDEDAVLAAVLPAGSLSGQLVAAALPPPCQLQRAGSLAAAAAAVAAMLRAPPSEAGAPLGVLSSTATSPIKAELRSGAAGRDAPQPMEPGGEGAQQGGCVPAAGASPGCRDSRPGIVVVGGIGPVAVDPTVQGAALECMIAEARAFAAEWRELRAVHQARLAGRVLQAPLEQAVEELQKEAAAAGAYGSSTYRFVDSTRTDLQLPEGAEWKPVKVKFPRMVNEVSYQQPFLPDGSRLCINCAAPVPGAEQLPESAALQGMQLLFCSGQCEARFALKCNGTAYRRALFKLERGKCVLCQLDCHDLVRRLQAIEKGSHMWEQRRQVLVAQLAPRFLQRGHKAQLERLVKNALEGNAWHADHIRAVYQGGGLCDVENLRTLCVLCHLDVTKQQTKERAQECAAQKARTKPGAAAEGGDAGSPKRLRRRARLQRVFMSDTDGDSPATRTLAACKVPSSPAGPGAQHPTSAAAAARGAVAGTAMQEGAESGGSAGQQAGQVGASDPEVAAGGGCEGQRRAKRRKARVKSMFGDDDVDATPSSASEPQPAAAEGADSGRAVMELGSGQPSAGDASPAPVATGAAARGHAQAQAQQPKQAARGRPAAAAKGQQAGAAEHSAGGTGPEPKRQALQRRIRQAPSVFDSPL